MKTLMIALFATGLMAAPANSATIFDMLGAIIKAGTALTPGESQRQDDEVRSVEEAPADEADAEDDGEVEDNTGEVSVE